VAATAPPGREPGCLGTVGRRRTAPAAPLDTPITAIYSHALNIKTLDFFAH
jgi:hypothetical protein